MRRSSAVTVAIAVALGLTGTGLRPAVTAAQAPPSSVAQATAPVAQATAPVPQAPVDDARMKADFRALLDRQRVLVAKVAAVKTPYDDLAFEAASLTKDFDGTRSRYTLELLRHPVDPFIAAVVRTGDSLASLFAAWSIEEREAHHAAWLKGELQAVKNSISDDSSPSDRALVDQHEHNIVVAERRVADARAQMLATWQTVKQSLALASQADR